MFSYFRVFVIICSGAGLLAGLGPASAQGASPDVSGDQGELARFAEMSLEELMAVQVTSVSGVGQKYLDTPAAMYVITEEDVRRTGHQFIPELLRLAPGVTVGRSGASRWGLSARGFNGGLANKSLVLIDGRAVYDPIFSGTFWDVQDLVLVDLERLEVVRGPGPTLWGSNAVNGVFNITTKSAKDTQGDYVQVGGGNEDRAVLAFRRGGRLSDRAWYRVWGKYRNVDAMVSPAGKSLADDWDMSRTGFRVDQERPDLTQLTVQGDGYYSDRIGSIVRVPVPGQHLQFKESKMDGRAAGGNVLVRFSRGAGGPEGWSLQTYYDRTERTTADEFRVDRDTVDLDLRRMFRLGARHELVAGLATRRSRDQIRNSAVIFFPRGGRALVTHSGFLQDTVALAPERVYLMAGSKVEHNNYTGWEVQPGARLWWTPDETRTVWASVTRAVRTPSRLERDGSLHLAYADLGLLFGGPPTGTIVPITVAGNPEADSERLLAWEAGYRQKISPELVADLALYYHDYDDLLTIPSSITGKWANLGHARAGGGELAVSWQAWTAARLEGSVSYLDLREGGKGFPLDKDATPKHQAQLRSYLDLGRDLSLDSAFYYRDHVPLTRVESYVRWDLGLAWRPGEWLDLSLWGRDLLDASHPESNRNAEVQRSVYFQAAVWF